MKATYYNIEGREIPFMGNANSTPELKFNRVAMIASRYPRIIKKLNEIVRQNATVPTNKDYNLAVATIVIIQTGIRVGNEDSANGYMTIPHPNSDEPSRFVKTYGLTTMLPSHVSIDNGIVSFDFIGKKQVENTFTLDRKLSGLVMRVINSNYDPVFNITESELTTFIKNTTGVNFSSKDFRTFRANIYAWEELSKIEALPTTKSEWNDTVNFVAEIVSKKLNNTPGVVKRSYVDPELFDYMLGKKDDIGKKPTNKKAMGGIFLVNFKTH